MREVSLSVTPTPSGLPVSHIAGGGSAAVIASAAVSVANHFGLTLSDPDALLIGAGALSIGAGLGHIVGRVGILGALRQLLRGRSA